MEAARNGFKATGVELNFWLVFYSKVTAYFQGLSSNTHFIKRDLWRVNLKSYDNVIIFGVEQMVHNIFIMKKKKNTHTQFNDDDFIFFQMKELEIKFCNELKENSQIIACRFPLPNLPPIKIIGQGVDTVWIYKLPLIK